MPASIPAWVPALFLLLLFIGYRQSLPRTVRPSRFVAVALALFGLSLFGVVNAFGSEPVALLSWASGYAIALVLGARHVASRGLSISGTSVLVPGSWTPLVLLLTIFAAKFVIGFAVGVQSPLVQNIGFIAALSAILGASSGGFGARALAVHRCAGATRMA